MKRLMVIFSFFVVMTSGLAACGSEAVSDKSNQDVQTEEKIKKVSLELEKTEFESNDTGHFEISGKTESDATLYLDGEKSGTADQDGNFTISGELKAETTYTAEVKSVKSGFEEQKVDVSLAPSQAYLALKEAERKKEEEAKIALEEKQAEQTEADQLFQKAEASLNSTDLANAENYIATSKHLSKTSYTTRISDINTKITAKRQAAEREKAKLAKAETEKKQAELRKQQEAARDKSSGGNANGNGAVQGGGSSGQAPSADESTPVLVTATGSKYHKRKCGNGTYTQATLAEAKSRGLSACSKCYR